MAENQDLLWLLNGPPGPQDIHLFHYVVHIYMKTQLFIFVIVVHDTISSNKT